MHRNFATLALAGLLATGGLAGPVAHAATSGESREATALQHAKLTLPQAITLAEQHTGGQAYDAGADVEHGKAVISVETNGPKGVQTVVIDANSGKILGTHAGPEQD